ncbi:hypothetical protein [Shewanella frigidimarina]|uniref:hypothetical protein n=1 Tax=Shewanella frigidimarina TaxID=56812 RepID=UPI003D78B7BD
MISNKNQKGFANLVILVVSLAVASMFIMHWQQRSKILRIQSVVTPFYQQLQYISQQIDGFQIDKIAEGWPPSSAAVFPNSFAELQPAYLPLCSTTDNNLGKCRKPEQTPWGTSMSFTKINSPVPPSVTPRYRILIQVPFPNATNDATRIEHQIYLETLGRFPGSEFNEATNSLSIWIERIDSGLQQEALVKRSGDDSTLTGDWDVGGNFAITNAKDVTVRNSDGSQRSLAAGAIAMVAKHNQRIDKHKCPIGLTPAIITGIKGIFNTTLIPIAFSNVSSSRSYSVSSSTYWTVKLDYWAEVQGVVTLLHDGEVNVELICQP